ncbi:hypothetical protein LSCM1_02390 [Leishmania martiniquensis]|uniref:Uncharacterized protein n=1 Tax=Leishmania martiniquensis TaxID=1580590 RepID=A0A836KF12_9TRYP|nr:hypothetical protein LSCM1_02390 [Leishmania martiniquensis]
MSSMSKLILAVAIAAAAMAPPAMALPLAATTTMTATPVPVNLSLNIVTTVLILGVSIAAALIFALWKLLPRIRSGELTFSKIEFDWRAELLNQTPKKEKARREAERLRRAEQTARREVMAADHLRDGNEGDVHYTMQPKVELSQGQKLRESDEAVVVTVPRE